MKGAYVFARLLNMFAYNTWNTQVCNHRFFCNLEGAGFKSCTVEFLRGWWPVWRSCTKRCASPAHLKPATNSKQRTHSFRVGAVSDLNGWRVGSSALRSSQSSAIACSCIRFPRPASDMAASQSTPIFAHVHESFN